MVAAILTSLWVSSWLFEPRSVPQIVFWWSVLIGLSSAVAWGVDRVARRLLPLATMLKATMLFPDRAPSRYRVALRKSNVTELRRRIADEAESGSLAKTAELTLSLATLLNDHDRKTRGHGERTRAYADMIAEEMRIPQEGRDKLRWAALLHDVGKLEVPAEVLNKDGPLTPDEYALMQRHPLIGMRVAAPIVPWLGEWAGAIEHHHERWDGTGYPRKLQGTEISLAARIVAVADSYDVMTSGRSYQKAISPAAARAELARMAGTQFDPTVVRAFMNISLGRLRWLLAPAASLGPIPFFFDRLGRDLVTLSTAATVTAAAVVAGAVPVPARRIPPPPVEAHFDPQAMGTTIPGSDTATAEGSGQEGPGSGGSTSPDTTSPDTPDTAVVPTTTPPSTDPPTTATPTTQPPGTTTPTTTPTTQPPGTTTPTTQPPATSPPPPVVTARPDVVTTAEDTAVTIAVLANDEGSGIYLHSLISTPAAGSASISGNSVVYTPNPNANGADTFGYRVCDDTGACAETTVAVSVTPVNDPPIIVNDTATTDSGKRVQIAVLANDRDPDGDTLTVQSVGRASSGTVTFDSTAVFYTSAPGFSGTDTFTYRACDPSGGCGTATVTVTVRSTTSPPIARNDSATTNPGGHVWIPVLANDSDPDGDLDPGSLTVVSGPTHGRIRVNGDRIRYSADRTFVGTDTFTYRVCDSAGACSTATVSVSVK